MPGKSLDWRTPVVLGTLSLALASGCGDAGALHESTGESESSIQGGSSDTTHNFVVGVVQQNNGAFALCSGVLLAPNLVATARHCVSTLTSAQIDCTTSRFTSTLTANDFFVTPQSSIPMRAGGFYSVVSGGVVVPSGTGVCGNDIALLILSGNISIPQYVVPTISPPMTDHQVYTTAYTAIGYGVDTPTDTSGSTAGVRRIRENINLSCIPNDSSFTDCLSFANALQFLSANEFEGGDGTCEGDSGSGAFDQGSFNNGNWVSFGVLSRGGVSMEGGTCQGAIYTRFDAWRDMLMQTANRAAMLGGYPAPAWAAGAGTVPPPTGSGAPAASCQKNGQSCGADRDCCSTDCLTFDNGATFRCVACDDNDPCSPGYDCQAGSCVSGTRSASPIPGGDAGGDASGAAGGSHQGGCSLGAAGTGDLPPPTIAIALGGAMSLAGRRLRRGQRGQSGQGGQGEQGEQGEQGKVKAERSV
ncbi:MAG: trypsin-like serine protease [Myxococcales bacterium]|nr:trypsin-like serine protease [Myxococcales bacterium]